MLNRGDGSAEKSTRVRASVSRGSEEDKANREWSAESFAEVLAADTGGEGSRRRVDSEYVEGEGVSSVRSGGSKEADAVA